MRVVLMSKTEWLVHVAQTCKKQAAMADWYALGLRDDPDAIDWPTVNDAIVERWSVSGLGRVKDMAWKIATGTERAER